MKKITIYLFIFLAAISNYQCSEDFLDKGLLSEVEETDFMTSESDAILATNAAYNVLRDWRYHGGYPILDIMSDDARKGSNPTDAIQIQAFENFSYTPSEGAVTNWFTTLYLAAKRCNLVVERAPDIDMDETLKNRLIGEARFIRALTYFNLVRLYGGVPIITTINPERKVARNTAEEVYNLIKEDLLFAAENLPEKSQYDSEDMGRSTRGAAKALLTKVYLYQKDFVNAEKYAIEVINSGQYSLEPNFERVFSKDGEFGSGSIFEIGARPEDFQNGGHQYGNTQGFRSNPNRGWGFNRPSWNLITFFEEGDPRLDATIIYIGETLDGITMGNDSATPDTTYADTAKTKILEIECYNQKVWIPGTGPLESWDHNVRVLRLADVMLMAAEAMNENGKTAEALTYVNKIRERARGGNNNILPDITSTSQSDVRDAILHERRAEMAMEQNRFFDLVRTGRAAEILGPLGFVAGKHDLFPIPQSEIDLSEGLLTQNPNW
ncbi:MAG: RagB/SusD family nutrient uptake outer membrane protein [Chitinophagales bacterium]